MDDTKPRDRLLVASIHNHTNVYRDGNEVNTGPVTAAEQIKSVQRMVRWHSRQAEVAKQLLARLQKDDERVMGAIVE